MTEKYYNLKLPKDAVYGMIIIFFSFHIFFIIAFFVAYFKSDSSIENIISIAFLIFYLSIGWGIPIYIYSLAPKYISISENELIVRYRFGKKDKTLTKDQILKVRLIKSYMSGEMLCQIFYGSKQNDLVTVNHKSGKKVYDWYYGHKEEDGPRPITNYYWRDKKKSR